jgi:hypothetical protein
LSYYKKRVVQFLGGDNIASSRYQSDRKEPTDNNNVSNQNQNNSILPNVPYRTIDPDANNKGPTGDQIFETVRQNRGGVIFYPRNRRETNMQNRTDL